jgi:hypothetical protein
MKDDMTGHTPKPDEVGQLRAKLANTEMALEGYKMALREVTAVMESSLAAPTLIWVALDQNNRVIEVRLKPPNNARIYAHRPDLRPADGGISWHRAPFRLASPETDVEVVEDRLAFSGDDKETP